MLLSERFKRAINALARLPGIGPRQATRLVFFLAHRGRAVVADLREALEELEEIKSCTECYLIHENAGEFCDICSSPNRDQSTIMIVEKDTDLISIEKTGAYAGRYLVVGDLRKSGILDDEQRSRLERLKEYIEKSLGGEAAEIIIGTNPTTFGDFSASLLAKELSSLARLITRLGRGIPTEGEIQLADEETLWASLRNRR